MLYEVITSLLIHAVYRLDKRGFDNIPETGPAVLICNHVSFIDPVVVMGAVRRPIRFIIVITSYSIHYTKLYEYVTIPVSW